MNLLEVKNLSISFKTEESNIKAVRGISFNIPKGKTVGLVGESGSGKSVTALSLMRLIQEPPGYVEGQINLNMGQQSSQLVFSHQHSHQNNQLNNKPNHKGKSALSSAKNPEHKNQAHTNPDILKWPEKEMRKLRGNRLSMIFQEPMSSLNPVFTVGNQIAEALILHQNRTKKQAYEQTHSLLKQVEVDPDRAKSYPHQLSGGQRQRVMIAMAIACRPDLLIADEPTTALDVTIQKLIMELLKNLQQKYNMSMLFITHDLGLIAEIADEILVMWEGRIVEHGSVMHLFKNPTHPYTKGLMACRPTLDKHSRRLPVMSDYLDKEGKEHSTKVKQSVKQIKNLSSKDVLLEIKNLKKYFPLKKTFFGKTLSYVRAVDDVSFTVRKGETLGLVGESGCGKTTLGRVILRLFPVSQGEIIYQGQNITHFSQKEMKPLRKTMQVIFQDPYASLNPRMTIGSSIKEPMIIHHIGKDNHDRTKKVAQLLERVGLTTDMFNRYPHEFSGGQRQRICIARALAMEPEFMICDESVSALDVSIQAQIINLLMDLQEEMDLTYIFISHDLSVVKFISDRVCVMNKGKIVEQNTALDIYKNPKEDYTKKLLSAIPSGPSF